MVNTRKSIVAIVAALAAVLASAPAFAHHHSRARIGIGFHIGVPVGGYYYPGPYYYRPYYPYYPPTVIYRSAPEPVYIEQEPAVAPAQNYWYYCADARAYYPYVKECAGGWQRVAPQPR